MLIAYVPQRHSLPASHLRRRARGCGLSAGTQEPYFRPGRGPGSHSLPNDPSASRLCPSSLGWTQTVDLKILLTDSGMFLLIVEWPQFVHLRMVDCHNCQSSFLITLCAHQITSLVAVSLLLCQAADQLSPASRLQLQQCRLLKLFP